MTRREVVGHTALLGTLALAGGGSLLALPTAASAAEHAGPDGASGRPTSPNGWQTEERANHISTVWTRHVPGTGCDVDIRLGEAATVLTHVVRRFHYEIDALRAGDVTGWLPPSRVRLDRPEGNQASGTAVAIRPGSYPPGARGGFFPAQLTVVRDILAECDGVVRWGGDDDRPYEALFSLDVPPGDERLTRLVTRLRTWADEPGAGAGTPVDVTDKGRRRAAEALERRQQAD
ncbi:hypothetical protein ACIQAC_16025 [Streptomyces sp. NPDC088387]|uniref:hypothetical protein n=1 Tax=Streptomyces sp. NPDC088387 TaxID=3365859 RepID=UPI0037F30883